MDGQGQSYGLPWATGWSLAPSNSPSWNHQSNSVVNDLSRHHQTPHESQRTALVPADSTRLTRRISHVCRLDNVRKLNNVRRLDVCGLDDCRLDNVCRFYNFLHYFMLISLHLHITLNIFRIFLYIFYLLLCYNFVGLRSVTPLLHDLWFDLIQQRS